MYNQYNIATNVQYLFQRLEDHERRIEQLELLIEELQNELNTLRKSNSGKIERIEYKFDQLKVERLEGTLNIGITPNGGIEPASIEDFSINKNDISVPTASQYYPQLFSNVQNQIHDYLNNGCYDQMKLIEEHHQYELDPNYRAFIVDDIRNQIDKRIEYYLKDMSPKIRNEEEIVEFENAATEKVITDINRTLEEFIKYLPREGV